MTKKIKTELTKELQNKDLRERHSLLKASFSTKQESDPLFDASSLLIERSRRP